MNGNTLMFFGVIVLCVFVAVQGRGTELVLESESPELQVLDTRGTSSTAELQVLDNGGDPVLTITQKGEVVIIGRELTPKEIKLLIDALKGVTND